MTTVLEWILYLLFLGGFLITIIFIVMGFISGWKFTHNQNPVPEGKALAFILKCSEILKFLKWAIILTALAGSIINTIIKYW